MKVKIETITTCHACGIQTPYETKECRVMTSQEFLNVKLAYLSELSNCSTLRCDKPFKKDGAWHIIVYGKPMINGKYQGCTSVWFTIKF